MDSLFFSKEFVKDSVCVLTVAIEAENFLVALTEFIKLRCMLAEVAAFAADPDFCIC